MATDKAGKRYRVGWVICLLHGVYMLRPQTAVVKEFYMKPSIGPASARSDKSSKCID
jgi:hypothetical protein